MIHCEGRARLSTCALLGRLDAPTEQRRNCSVIQEMRFSWATEEGPLLSHCEWGARWPTTDYLQISTADRTHARTGPDTQRAQAHNHTTWTTPWGKRAGVFGVNCRAEIQGARAEIMAWIMVEFTAENNGGRICDCVYGALELICHACEHCMIDLPI